MNQNITRTQSLSFENSRTYLLAALFIVGNVAAPQLAHLMPGGGFVFLPIYFFTLLGTLMYGWRVGLITAVLSPVVNNLLFGMPPVQMLPVIEVKSVILATVAGIAMHLSNKLNLRVIAAVVIVAFVAGGLFEWAWTGSLSAAVQDFKVGFPGLLLQIFGCYAVISLIGRGKR